MMPNEYEYDDPEEGMQDAVERARERGELDAIGKPVKYDPADQPTPDPAEGLPAAEATDVTPEWGLDLTQQSPGDSTPEMVFKEPSPPTHAKAADTEYAAAMKRLTESFGKPAPDYAKGYAGARKKDESENRINRIMDLLSAGLRRAPTPEVSPAATNAAGFLQAANLERGARSGELSQLGLAARLAKPGKGSAPAAMTPYQEQVIGMKKGANEQAAAELDALREYAYKRVPTLRPGDLDGMGTKGVEAVLREAGLLERAKIHAAAVARGLSEKHETRVGGESRELAGKLGDTAAFEQRYQKIKALAEANGGEIPGLGFVEGIKQQPGVVGNVARAVSPPSEAAIEARKGLQQLAADYKKAISGAGVNEAESSRLEQATVDVNNGDSRIAMAGLESLREMYEAKAGQLKRGYSPEAVERVTGGEIRVRRKSDGSTGTLPKEDFDPKLYERL